jgi:hypothetical protein
MKPILSISLTVIFAGCLMQTNDNWRYGRQAYVAQTMSLAELRSSVKVTGAQKLKNPGKIYALSNYLFVNEKRKGVHIFDNTDPRNPKNLAFVSVPGSTDMAARANALYVDNAIDLVTINISDAAHPTIASRVQNALPPIAPSGGALIYNHFDPNTEVVIDWKDTTIYD